MGRLANPKSITVAGMTWAIHSIVYRDLGDEAEAARYFVKGYDSYVRGAFKTWHEGYGVFGGVCVSTRSPNDDTFGD